MRSEDAVDIVRASLALAFPTASFEGLTRAAETVIRWGSEDAADFLNEPLTTRMLLDLAHVAGVAEADIPSAEEGWLSDARIQRASDYRTWSRSDGMPPLRYRSRPPEDPTPAGGPDDPLRPPPGPSAA